MVTQRMIAEKAGVSYATVSRALTGSAKVSRDAIFRIKCAMNELGVGSLDEVLLPSRSTSRLVLVIIGDLSKEYYANIYIGIQEALAKENYQAVLCNSYYDTDVEFEAIRRAEEQMYAGIILVTVMETAQMVQELTKCTLPIVLVNRYIRSIDLDVVRLDNYRAGYMAGSYLAENGHTHIAMLLTQSKSAVNQDRLLGFSNALQDKNIAVNENDFFYNENNENHDVLAGKEFALQLLQKGYTAAIIGNDIMTIGAIQELTRNNLSVPDDVSIICFDNSQIMDEYGLNITAMSSNPIQLGLSAGEQLLYRIKNPLDRKVKLICSPEMIIRSSVKNRTALNQSFAPPENEPPALQKK